MTEVVHPLPTAMRLVLYTLVGEEPEAVEEGKNRTPDANFNAFPLRSARESVRLDEVLRAFPLGDAYHFAFRNEQGVYVDLTNPSAVVPTWQRKIVARVTPLECAPEVKYIKHQVAEEPVPTYTEHVDERPDYEEYQSFRGSFLSVDDDRTSHDEREAERPDRRWKSPQSRPMEDQYDSAGSRNSNAGNMNADWLRKQTEQAKDFAKKINMEDAKKGASETAKKAKKWGASLLSSVSASIASATSAVKNDTIQVGGITVNVVRPLADGAYAQVLLVRSNGSGETMALKRIICQSEEVERDVQTELRVLRTVKHLNVVPLIEFGEARLQHQEFYFLFPFFERGSLWDAIESARESSSPLWPFSQRVALHLFRGICAGLLAVHRAGFCHRDLKPHNVLLTSSSAGEDFMAYIPVVTDFGSCAPIRVEVRSRKNSLDLQDEASRKSSAPYRAPELFEPVIDGVIDGQSDVWSLGCILYAMAFGSSPFEHPRDGFMKLACMNGRVSFPPEQNGVVRHRSTQFTHEFCDFIRDMLHTNPEERPSVLDALEFAEELLSDEMKR